METILNLDHWGHLGLLSFRVEAKLRLASGQFTCSGFWDLQNESLGFRVFDEYVIFIFSVL